MRDPIAASFARHKMEVRNIDVAGSGAGSRVYHVVTDHESFAVKVALYPERRDQVIREFEIRRRLVEQGLDFVPRPHWTDEELFRNGASIYEYVSGEPLECDGSADEKTLHRIAGTLAELHALDLRVIPNGFQMAEELLGRVKVLVRKTVDEHERLVNDELRDGLSRAVREVGDKLHECRSAFTIGLVGRCHDDVAGNIVVGEDGKLWLVDWENSCVEDIVEEMVSVSTELNLPEDRALVLFERYQALFPAAREVDFIAMSRAYDIPTPICNICYSIDFLDVNLRHALDPNRYADALVGVAESTRGSMADSISGLLIQGAVKTARRAAALARQV
ncbi:MAG: aminoglycoside phosphotransferase family protein [Spirochaetia bacterium]